MVTGVSFGSDPITTRSRTSHGAYCTSLLGSPVDPRPSRCYLHHYEQWAGSARQKFMLWRYRLFAPTFCIIFQRLGLVAKSGRGRLLLSELITTVFVRLPLVLPGFAKYINICISVNFFSSFFLRFFWHWYCYPHNSRGEVLSREQDF